MSNKQMDSPAYCPTSPSVKPTIGGIFDGIKGTDLEGRTSSPNAESEKLYENQKDSTAKKTGA